MPLFSYYFKGAKVDAALVYLKKKTIPKGNFVLPGAISLPEGPNYFDQKDTITQWEKTAYFKLILKNNSKYFAYNIDIINTNEIFTHWERLKKLTSLAPNESLELEVNITQLFDLQTGVEPSSMPVIPEEKQNKILEIQYTNESGKKLRTRFWISFHKNVNEYSFV